MLPPRQLELKLELELSQAGTFGFDRCKRKSSLGEKKEMDAWLLWNFLSAAIGQRPRNYLSCSCCSCSSPFGSFPHMKYHSKMFCLKLDSILWPSLY